METCLASLFSQLMTHSSTGVVMFITVSVTPTLSLPKRQMVRLNMAVTQPKLSRSPVEAIKKDKVIVLGLVRIGMQVLQLF